MRTLSLLPSRRIRIISKTKHLSIFSNNAPAIFAANYITMENEVKAPTAAPLEERVDLMLWTAQLLMQSGADSNRIERNLRRVTRFMGIPLSQMHMHINYTTLMITVTEGKKSFTKSQKCTRHNVNMTAISAISRLSVKVTHGQYSIDEYRNELERISKITHHYSRGFTLVAIGLGCGAFCKLLGGDWPAVGFAVVASATALFIRQELFKRKINLYMTIAVSAFVATLISGSLTYIRLSADPHFAMLSSVLFLIPGVPLINSLDDMVDGYTIVGLTRAIIGSLVVGAIAFGMIMAMNLLNIENI